MALRAFRKIYHNEQRKLREKTEIPTPLSDALHFT